MFEKLTRFETSEETTPGTGYYRNTYDQLKAAIFATVKELDLTVKSYNDTHKEFLIKHKNYEIMAVAYNVTILETALDLVVLTPVMKSGKKIADQFYATMKKHATPK